MSDDAALEVERQVCASFPETSERLRHCSPTFFIRGKKTFTNFHADHHGDGRTAIWFAAPPGMQEQLLGERRSRRNARRRFGDVDARRVDAYGLDAAGRAELIAMWDAIGGAEHFDRRRAWWVEQRNAFAATLAEREPV